jgi:hypothetical protein
MARRAAVLESAEAAKTPEQRAAERREARAVLCEFARRWQTLRDLFTLASLAEQTNRDSLWDVLVSDVDPALRERSTSPPRYWLLSSARV